MKIFELEKINKDIFTINDICKALEITYASAKVSASRYVNTGYLLRLKRDNYIIKAKFKTLSTEKLFEICNFLQVPSYISFMTALSYYNLTTQVQQGVTELISLKRTKEFTIENNEIIFRKIRKDLFFGFRKIDDFFIATPEKAIFDIVYLTSMYRYACDFDSINFKNINISLIDREIKKTNEKTVLFWRDLCKTYKILKSFK